MSSAGALYVGSVLHRRLRPRAHGLRYRLFQLLLDLDELPVLARRLRLFSLDRFNLFSLHARDYGDGSGRALRLQVQEMLGAAGIDTAGGPIRLLTMPRLLGFAFNPLSLYFCHRPDGTLAAVLYEVNNTFGQRHWYVADTRGGGTERLRHGGPKAFYVSPFLAMDLAYRFQVAPPGDTFKLAIAVSDRRGVVLTAVQSQKRVGLDDRALLLAFARYPLLTLKVVAGIHWEALRLCLKGVRLTARPPPPPIPVSVLGHDASPPGARATHSKGDDDDHARASGDELRPRGQLRRVGHRRERRERHMGSR